MDGETNGSQQTSQAQPQAEAGGQEGQQQAQTGQQGVGTPTPDYEKQIAERDEKIASLVCSVK